MPKRTPRPLVAVGDAHGEYHGLAAVLIDAGLMDAELAWKGGSSILLQIGDILDRGPDPLEIDTLLEILKPQARAAGGDIIKIIGNHELEVLRKNYFISNHSRSMLESFRPKLIEGIKKGRWQAAYANRGYLFTHAGVCDSLFNLLKADLHGKKLTAASAAREINKIFKEAVLQNDYRHPIFNVSFHRGGGDRFGGIFWEDLSALLDNYHLCPFKQIIGHTVVGRIVMTADRKVFCIDVGMKKVFEGSFEYLKITGKNKIDFCKVG